MFPFSGIVGQDEAKLALAIAAVDPGMGGVLLSGMKGTGKSTLVRSFVDILPDRKVVENCLYGCTGVNDGFLCDDCRQALESGNLPDIISVRPKLITVPLGVTEDRLLGTIDVELLLREGMQKFQPGLMAGANNQVLYVDEVNLLPDNITDDVLDACASDFNTVEREGISLTHPARFILVGTMNPEEGNLRPQILDRFAMSVDIRTERDPALRIEIIERTLAYENDRDRFNRAHEKTILRLRKTISAARLRLHDVKLPVAAIETVAESMSELNVDGQRPDIVMIRAAIAWSALEGKHEVNSEALLKVAPLCVCHRTRSGGMDQPPTRDELMEQVKTHSSKAWKSGNGIYYDPENIRTVKD